MNNRFKKCINVLAHVIAVCLLIFFLCSLCSCSITPFKGGNTQNNPLATAVYNYTYPAIWLFYSFIIGVLFPIESFVKGVITGTKEIWHVLWGLK